MYIFYLTPLTITISVQIDMVSVHVVVYFVQNEFCRNNRLLQKTFLMVKNHFSLQRHWHMQYQKVFHIHQCSILQYMRSTSMVCLMPISHKCMCAEHSAIRQHSEHTVTKIIIYHLKQNIASHIKWKTTAVPT